MINENKRTIIEDHNSTVQIDNRTRNIKQQNKKLTINTDVNRKFTLEIMSDVIHGSCLREEKLINDQGNGKINLKNSWKLIKKNKQKAIKLSYN